MTIIAKVGVELANLLWDEGKRTVGVLWDNSAPDPFKNVVRSKIGGAVLEAERPLIQRSI